jgi:hypothetical protein
LIVATTSSNGFEEITVNRSISTFLIILAPFKSFLAPRSPQAQQWDDTAIACLGIANELIAFVQCCATAFWVKIRQASRIDRVDAFRAFGNHRSSR